VVASIAGALPAGTNNIGDVDVLTLPALAAGTNNIGDVDVLTLPALAAGTNTIGGTRQISKQGTFYDDALAIPLANATTNGAARDAFAAAADGTAKDAPTKVKVLARANQSFTLGLDFTRDPTGSPTFRPWRRIASSVPTGESGENVAEIEAPVIARGWRIMYKSGATAASQLDIVSGMVAE